MVLLPPNTTIRGHQSLPSDWLTQWDRVQRSFRRLAGVGGPDRASVVTTEDLRDDVVHFFMDCYHLKDWLKNDPNVTLNQNVESWVKQSVPLCVVADVANGQKHLKLTTTRTGDFSTALGDVTLAGDASGIGISFEILSQGQSLELGALASDAMQEWADFLVSEDLLLPKTP